MLQTRHDPVEHGDLSALLCLDDAATQASVIDQLSQLGFAIHTAVHPEEAPALLTAHPYEIIVIGEHFGGADAGSNSVLSELGRLPLDQRRRSYAVLLGPGMESRSEMLAFLHSVDLTLHLDELPDFKTIVGKGIVRQESYYESFLAVRKSVLGG